MIALAVLIASVPQASWNSASLGSARADISTTVDSGRLYVIGGYDGGGAVSAAALFAPLGGDGSPGSFGASSALALGGGGLGMASAGGRMYVIGFNSNQSYAAPINGDGTLGSFAAVDALPYDPYAQGLVSSGNKLWFAGGAHVTGTSPNFTYTSYANSSVGVVNAGTGAVAWTAGAQLPHGVARHGLATDGTFLWTVGGQWDGSGSSPGASTTDVEVSRLDSSTGVPGTWHSTTSLPSPRYSVASFVSGGFLFAIGGHTDTPGQVLGEVLQARINTDGTVGAWIAGPPLPQARYLHAASANLGYAYVVAGYTTDYTADIEWKKLTTPGPAAKLFISGLPATAHIGDCVGPIDISVVSASDELTWVDADVFVNLSVNHGVWHSENTCGAGSSISQAMIAGGTDSKQVWVYAQGPSTVTLGAVSAGLSDALSATFDVTGSTESPDGGTSAGPADDPHTVNGWGCSSAGAGWLALAALLFAAQRHRRIEA